MNPSPGRSLMLQAYNGEYIPNHIDPDPTSGAVALAEAAYRRLLKIPSIRLGPATGRYNCHGLVFAARRTNIPPVNFPDAINILDLLQADEYEPVHLSPQTGDLVIYRSPHGQVEHSGFVSRAEKIGRERIIFVWSMWGGLGEFEHREDLSPYDDCTREYWRLKR